MPVRTCACVRACVRVRDEDRVMKKWDLTQEASVPS